MKEENRESLDLNDEELFTRGACHVFASVLIHQIPDQVFELAMVSSVFPTHPNCNTQARHIVCSRGEFIVDVRGVRMWSDYVEQETAKLREWYSRILSDVRLTRTAITEDDLFTVARDTPRYGPVNRWEHCLEADFLVEARSRAVSYVSENRRRFLIP